MKPWRKMVALAVLSGACLGAGAGELDGSAPILCAVTTVVACEGPGVCVHGSAEAVNLPVFFRFDGAAKSVVAVTAGGTAGRTSAIDRMVSEGGTLTFSGIDAGAGWSAVIQRPSGALTATVTKDQVGYMVFGSCLPL